MTRRSLWAAGLVLTLGAAACGSTQSTSPKVSVRNAARLVAATADATTKAKTAKVAAHVDMYGGALGRSLSFDMDGAMAFDGSAAEFTVNLGALIPSAPANSRVEERVVDGVIYMDMGSLLRGIGGMTGDSVPPSLDNIKWLELDLRGLTSGSPNSLSDFTQYLEYLRGASKDGVHTIGNEKVRGVDTTHYQAEIEWSRLVSQLKERLDKVSPEVRATLQQGIDQLQSTRDPVVIDVWIDSDGITRRLTMRIPMPSAQLGNATMKMQMDLYDFGTPLDVHAPPASEVRDFSELQDLIGSSSS